MIDELERGSWQHPVDALPKGRWDVLIVGAGPAGATAAIHLRSHGYRVLLLDQEAFPREKVCGDALIMDAIRALQRAGLYDQVRSAGHELRTVSVFSPSRVEIELPGQSFTLRRRVLDALIARGAVDRGAFFCKAHVCGLKLDDDGSILCQVSETDRILRARIGIIATGANVKLMESLGAMQRRSPSALAARCYVRSSYRVDRLIVSYDRSIIPGYAWVFPLGNEEYNVGCGVFYRGGNNSHGNLRKMYETFVREFPIAKELLRQGKPISPFRGAMLRCSLKGTQALVRGNLLAIGETIGATFPYTGEGIGKAMETGELASDVIHAAFKDNDFGYLQEFPTRLAKELKYRYLGYEIAESWLSRAWLNDFMARRTNRSKYLQESLAGILNETVDPREVFSLKGMLRSLWR